MAESRTPALGLTEQLFQKLVGRETSRKSTLPETLHWGVD